MRAHSKKKNKFAAFGKITKSSKKASKAVREEEERKQQLVKDGHKIEVKTKSFWGGKLTNALEMEKKRNMNENTVEESEESSYESIYEDSSKSEVANSVVLGDCKLEIISECSEDSDEADLSIIVGLEAQPRNFSKRHPPVMKVAKLEAEESDFKIDDEVKDVSGVSLFVDDALGLS